MLISVLTSKRAIKEYISRSCSVQNLNKAQHHHILCNEVSVSDGHVRWTVCILLNMAAVSKLNLNNLNNLTIVDVAKLHVDSFGHCIKLYLRLFVDYEHLIYKNIKSHKIARYILFNKQVNRSKHIFYNN